MLQAEHEAERKTCAVLLGELGGNGLERLGYVLLDGGGGYAELLGYLAVLERFLARHAEDVGCALWQRVEGTVDAELEFVVEQLMVGSAQEVGVVERFGVGY